jgi:tetratricopeptide (TPR) repeat protein
MLSQFKSKVAENIEEEDATSHYDLGVAFKEMGLIDEAIAEFQIAARGMDYRLRAIEMLGSCFLEKEDFRIALKVLGRALQVPDYKDEDLVGVFYAMGRAYEALGEVERALEWYERVLGCDVSFKDVSDRVAALR